MQTYAQVTIRALATSQNGAKQSSVVTRTFTVHKAEEGSDVDTASITSEGEQTVSEIDEYLRLVPRPLPDFISQPWRKIGRRPGIIATSQTGNGGLG